MKKISIASILAILVTLSSCKLVGDIFQAGVWVGVLMVVGILVLAIVLLGKLFGGK
jgi:hypothetical protein